ncbi:hypothetical protein [Bradyrhizobium sp. sBnM-33]|uniref:hypothetical protein n=1 Tax=Bradyrhizobium sp. sBnM-33 TaxID=2831780 RepID=UPI001BCCB618|nr:hypothetical protein [Bradyrhizobium sp. sBnM-33]WOH53774.1 hypothetical protein RX328_17790 [Bradyrhizobium sp. sBnM-33]
MSRSRSRVCLQDGLKLDINRLARNSFIKFGANIGVKGIAWKHSYWGEIARGLISADMTDACHAWLKVELGEVVQRITLVSRRRHFGGPSVVFSVPSDISAGHRSLETAGSPKILQPRDVGAAGGIRVAVLGSR